VECAAGTRGVDSVTVIGTRKAFPHILGMPFDSSRYSCLQILCEVRAEIPLPPLASVQERAGGTCVDDDGGGSGGGEEHQLLGVRVLRRRRRRARLHRAKARPAR